MGGGLSTEPLEYTVPEKHHPPIAAPDHSLKHFDVPHGTATHTEGVNKDPKNNSFDQIPNLKGLSPQQRQQATMFMEWAKRMEAQVKAGGPPYLRNRQHPPNTNTPHSATSDPLWNP
jgi:hypothetical protein